MLYRGAQLLYAKHSVQAAISERGDQAAQVGRAAMRVEHVAGAGRHGTIHF